MLRAGFILTAALLSGSAACAQDASLPGPAPAEATVAESAAHRLARERLFAMARALGEAQRFSFSAQVAYEVVQDNGQKIEFGEVRDVEVDRPQRVRITETAAGSNRTLLLLDGEAITVQDGATRVYAQAPQPGDIDESIRYFVRDLQMRLPLAPLLMADLAGELQRRVHSIDYVGLSDVLGEPAHHVAARTARVDFQVWIADADRPLPLRIVITYPEFEGHPQFRADFSKWDLSPTFAADRFEFKPGADAMRILFAVQLVPPADAGASRGDQVVEGGRP